MPKEVRFKPTNATCWLCKRSEGSTFIFPDSHRELDEMLNPSSGRKREKLSLASLTWKRSLWQFQVWSLIWSRPSDSFLKLAVWPDLFSLNSFQAEIKFAWSRRIRQSTFRTKANGLENGEEASVHGQNDSHGSPGQRTFYKRSTSWTKNLGEEEASDRAHGHNPKTHDQIAWQATWLQSLSIWFCTHMRINRFECELKSFCRLPTMNGNNCAVFLIIIKAQCWIAKSFSELQNPKLRFSARLAANGKAASVYPNLAFLNLVGPAPDCHTIETCASPCYSTAGNWPSPQVTFFLYF